MTVVVDPDRELEELRLYLGDAFDETALQSHEQRLMEELEAAPDEESLYRSSQMYLYDLTVFAMSRTKAPYVDLLTRHVAPGARLLDLGCGIGADGLALLEAGYDVTFADFDNPSTAFLRWRLEHRGLQATIVDLDRDPLPSGHDLAYAFDVIEHVPDPFAFLRTMEAAATRVLVNVLEPEEGETTLHHELPVKALEAHAAAQHLVALEVHHGRSHVLLYRTGPSSGVARLRSRAVLAGARARRMLRRS